VRRFFGLLVMFALWVAPAAAHDNSIPHPTLPECIAGDPRLMLPDFYPEQPFDVRNSRKLGRRKLEFTTMVGNIGEGPLILDGKTISDANGIYTHAWQIIKMRDGTECARSAGQFVYHPQHTHYHFNRWIAYQLRVGDPLEGHLTGTSWKASFCLLDNANLRGYPSSIYQQERGLSCGSPEGRMGISVGWADVYERHLPDQNIDLDGPNPVEPGGYYLSLEVDPEERLWELDRSNNISYVLAGVTIGVPDRDSEARQPPLLPDNAVPIAKPSRRPTTEPTGAPSVQPTPVPTQVEGRPTRPPKPTKPPKAPKPPKPTKAPRPGRTSPPEEPTSAPTASASPERTPTVPPVGGSCNPTCFYNLKQMRMTWLSQTGLSLTGTIDMRGCPAISVSGTQSGFLNTYNWMTEDFESDTGITHNTTFVLQDGAGDTSTGGRFNLSSSNNTALFAYSLAAEPPSNAADGQNFPVVFDFCMGVGGQTIAGRLVCQPKATGMLCHE